MVGEELLEIATVQQHRTDEAVCAVAFDPTYDLVWTASTGGAVQSYLCPSLDRYSEWRGHVQPVLTRGLLITAAHGPLSASADALQLHARGGLPIMTYREPAGDLRCLEWERTGGTRVLLGHSSGRVATFDLPTARVISEVSSSQGVEVLRSNGRLVVCGGVGGELSLRDVRTMRVESTLEAHIGPVQALDIKGDLLVSCGLSQRAGRIFCDPLIKVFDIRQAARALTHIPFAPGPSMIRFQPKFSSVLLVASASGAAMLTDVQGGGVAFQSYQVGCDGAALLACDVSPSGELLAFGDSAGVLHLWGSRDDAPVSMFSQPLELPDPLLPSPQIPLQEEDPFSHAYRLEAEDMALSALDPNTIMRVGLPPRTVDSSLQEAMSLVDFVGYVQNPLWRRGMSYAAALEATSSLRNGRQLAKGEDMKDGIENGTNLSSMSLRTFHNSSRPALPKGYRHVEIKQSQSAKFEEFDFSYYNRTRFAGLENDFSDSHINALLQVFYFTPELKDMVTIHICEREFCLTCELGFVLHMLALAEGSTCQPTNLIRALRQMREVSAMGLLGDWENSESKPLGERVWQLSQFVLEQLHKEVSSQESVESSLVDALYGMTVEQRTKCLRSLHDISSQERRMLQVDLQYPPPRAGPRPLFAEILQRSLQRQEDVRAWCQSCRSYQPVSQIRKPNNLPQILLINCSVVGDQELSFWHTEPAKEDRSPESKVSAIVRTSSGALGSEQWLPFHLDIELDSSGVKVTEELGSMGARLPENLDSGTVGAAYELTAVISHVQDDSAETDYKSHLVAHIKVPMRYGESHLGSLAFSPTASSGTLSPTITPHVNSGHRLIRRSSFSQTSLLHNASIIATTPLSSETRGTPPQGSLGGPGGSPGGSPIVASPGLSNASSGDWKTDSRLRRSTSSPAVPLGISEGERQAAEGSATLVTLSRSDSRGGSAPGDWVLFNDFCITPTSMQEVVTFYGKRKTPCLLQYTRVQLASGGDVKGQVQLQITVPPRVTPLVRSSPISDDLFKRLIMEPSRSEGPRSFWPLELPREQPRPGMLLGIDAEFVALAAPELGIREDGSEFVQRPSRLGLARVSVVRGEGPNTSVCCIDDYIRTVEPVYDYLTRYSGLQHGDLDEGVSQHHLISMKKAYIKLRYLVDMGCTLVGHGLKKDFRIINMVVPQEQVVDTVDLFHLKRLRKLSLRFLASYLLKIDIQKETHDSIEDARTALRLYDKYKELMASGEFQEKLLEIYHYGRRHGWDMGNGGVKESPGATKL